jgi:stage II sporulation protein M
MRIIKENARFIWLGFALMLLGAIIGYVNAETIQSFAKDLLKELERIAERIKENDSPLYTFWVIFENNVMASLSMLGLGIFFGIYPALALFSNGILLGFILKSYALKGMSPISLFVVGILPHGAIELFAVILAAGMGMRYGVTVFKLLGYVFNMDQRTSILKEFGTSLQDLPYLVGTVVLLLFIAAVIESTLTPMLIQLFLGDALN